MNWEMGERLYWLLGGVGVTVVGAIGTLAVIIYKSKETLKKVPKNEESVKALQAEMTTIKGDITEIKEGVDRQGQDTAMMLCCLQSIMNALYDSGCNIGPAREKFGEFLANRGHPAMAERVKK